MGATHLVWMYSIFDNNRAQIRILKLMWGVYFENLMSSTNILLGHFIFLCITYILVLVYHFLYELLVSNALIDPISLFLGRSRVETIIVPYFPIQAYVLASYRSFRQHIFGTEFQIVIGMVRQGFLLQRT